eukprot:1158975-Pelagomonas_calceolata.AAC.22
MASTMLVLHMLAGGPSRWGRARTVPPQQRVCAVLGELFWVLSGGRRGKDLAVSEEIVVQAAAGGSVGERLFGGEAVTCGGRVASLQDFDEQHEGRLQDAHTTTDVEHQ